MILLAALLATAQQNAEVAMLKCFYSQAVALDDRVSDPTSIARGVVNACHPQFDDWKFASFEDRRPPSATVFYRRLEQAASSMATEVVLRVRAASK